MKLSSHLIPIRNRTDTLSTSPYRATALSAVRLRVSFLLQIGITLSIALLCASYAQAQSAPAAPPPDCLYCKEKLLTLSALRQALPADWQLQTERDPVFGGNILVVQAGMQNPQTLVLVHGLGQNGFTDWVSVMPQLAQRYHVITFDFPGFGYSASPNGKYSPRNYARVLSNIIAEHAKGRAIVIGHSLGGAVALRFASDYPTQLDKLILVDAAGILHRTAFVKHSARVRLDVEQMPAFLKGAIARLHDLSNDAIETIASLPDPTRLLDANDTVWGSVLANRANANAAMALVEEDYSAIIPVLQTPTWIIWGEADTVAPLRTGQMLARRLPQAQLLTMPGVGHTPMDQGSASTFYPKLTRALNNIPQSEPRPEAPSGALTDLHCQGLTDRVYSGHFREVFIDGCTAIKLHNVSAEHIVLRDAIVQMLNVQVRAKGTALEVINSELIATAGELNGDIAIRADKARIDLAGFKLEARRTAIEVQRTSRLIGSVNEITSPAYSGNWQGSEEIEMGVLAP